MTTFKEWLEMPENKDIKNVIDDMVDGSDVRYIAEKMFYEGFRCGTWQTNDVWANTTKALNQAPFLKS